MAGDWSGRRCLAAFRTLEGTLGGEEAMVRQAVMAENRSAKGDLHSVGIKAGLNSAEVRGDLRSAEVIGDLRSVEAIGDLRSAEAIGDLDVVADLADKETPLGTNDGEGF
jgi:hypothetical protein